MGSPCSNQINVAMTKGEWNELVDAFHKGQIAWPPPFYTEVGFLDREIFFATKTVPEPLNDGSMEALSRKYPSAIFQYIAETDICDPEEAWYCNGKTFSLEQAFEIRAGVYKEAVERMLANTPTQAKGPAHSVTVLPDGTVAAEGENSHGECDTAGWTDICQVSCGNTHTVGLKKDGTVVACGSNVNGQCNVTDLPGKAVAVSCGRYHTAILLASGRVILRGKPEQERITPYTWEETPLLTSDFPLVREIRLENDAEDWRERNQRIEALSAGDTVKLQLHVKPTTRLIEVLNQDDEKLGNLPITVRGTSNDGQKISCG